MPGFVAEKVVAFERRLAAREDATLKACAAEVDRRGLPRITPESGRTLEVLVQALAAERVLEVGTCLGYSTIWMARGQRRGAKLQTVDLLRERADAAREWVKRARVPGKVEFLVGDAHAVLPTLRKQAYDLVFVDADKEGMPFYLKEALRLVRRGGIIAADNVFWHGAALDPDRLDAGAREVRAFVKAACEHPDLTTTILPLGDGLLVAVRR